MPVGRSTHREQSHGEWRCIDDTNTAALEEVEILSQQIVVQTIVAEVENALHRTLLTVLNHPLEVFGLQVGDTHMTNHPLLAQFHESGQCLIHHLLQVGKLHVVHIDKVDEIHIQSLHTLIHALLGTLGRVVPIVHSVLAISPHLGGEHISVALDVLERLAQHHFSLEMPVIRRHINKVNTAIHSRMHSLDSLILTYSVEYSTQRRGSKPEVGYFHPRLSNLIKLHI